MVNFNNDTTIGTPAVDVIRILLLEKRENIFLALEQANTQSLRGIDTDLSEVRSRIKVLFLEIQAGIKRRWPTEKYNDLRKRSYEVESEKEIIKVIEEISEYLDDLRITRIDTKQVYDSTKTSEEDKIKGYS